MPSPWKHPKTGVFYIRVKAPKAVRSKVDYDTYQRTLGTKNLAEAKVLLSEGLAELNEEWARLLAEPGRLTRKQSKAIAGEFRLWSIAAREDDPGKPEDLRRQIERDRLCINPGRRMPGYGPVLGDKFEAFLKKRGIVVHPADHSRLARDCAEAEVSAKETLLRYAMGDFSKAKDVDQYPEYVPAQPLANQPVRSRSVRASTGSARLSVQEHWEQFAAHKEHSLGTQKAYQPVLVKFTDFLGREDLATATPAEIGAWKDKLLEPNEVGVKLSKKRVSDTYLTALRGFLEWGVEGGKLAVNPAANIKVSGAKSRKSRKVRRSLNDGEARLILSETLRPSSSLTSKYLARAKRWVPWLCAYIGARVNEITQARRKDVSMQKVGDEDVWLFEITMEAGTVKNGQDRTVVLHPHLIEQGFIEFVKSCPDGPLFYNPERKFGGSDKNPPFRKTGDRLAEWIRELGVDDTNVDPNHGWRHKFKTTARSAKVRMDHEVREAITGHAPATVGDDYGEMPVDRMWEEICRLPRFEVQPPTGPLPDTPARRKRNAARVATAERAKARKLPDAGRRAPARAGANVPNG